MAGLERLDDEDYPSVSMGQAAELLGVQPAFLRSLDAAGVLNPHRTDGGHRRYSRRQLAYALRLRELLDDGHSLTSARTIIALEERVALSDAARDRATAARDQESADHRQTRTDLRDRTDELHRARQQLDEARDEIDVLQRGLGHVEPTSERPA